MHLTFFGNVLTNRPKQNQLKRSFERHLSIEDVQHLDHVQFQQDYEVH